MYCKEGWGNTNEKPEKPPKLKTIWNDGGLISLTEYIDLCYMCVPHTCILGENSCWTQEEQRKTIKAMFGYNGGINKLGKYSKIYKYLHRYVNFWGENIKINILHKFFDTQVFLLRKQFYC